MCVRVHVFVLLKFDFFRTCFTGAWCSLNHIVSGKIFPNSTFSRVNYYYVHLQKKKKCPFQYSITVGTSQKVGTFPRSIEYVINVTSGAKLPGLPSDIV